MLKKKEQKEESENQNPQRDDDTPQQEEEHHYLCRNCRTPVAQIGSELQVGDIPIQTMQINPHGYIHEVITVKEAFNIFLYGSFVPADSWFPGYLWRFCHCRACGNHIGWSYHRPKEESYTFIGLRKGSVTQQ